MDRDKPIERFGWDKDYFQFGKRWYVEGLPRPETAHLGEGWDEAALRSRAAQETPNA